MADEVEAIRKIKQTIEEAEKELEKIKIEEIRNKLAEAIDITKKQLYIAEFLTSEYRELYRVLRSQAIQKLEEIIEALRDIRLKARKRVIEIYNSDKIKIYLTFENADEEKNINYLREMLSTLITQFYSESQETLHINFDSLLRYLFGDNVLGHDLNDIELSYRIFIDGDTYGFYIIANVIRNCKVIKSVKKHYYTPEEALYKNEYEIYKKVRPFIEEKIFKENVEVERTMHEIIESLRAKELIEKLEAYLRYF